MIDLNGVPFSHVWFRAFGAITHSGGVIAIPRFDPNAIVVEQAASVDDLNEAAIQAAREFLHGPELRAVATLVVPDPRERAAIVQRVLNPAQPVPHVSSHVLKELDFERRRTNRLRRAG